MSHFVLRIKNDHESKSRVLHAILKNDPTYSIKEYKEERDPLDGNHVIISLTVYEKGPYCPIKKILHELKENKEIECLDGSLADTFL